MRVHDTLAVLGVAGATMALTLVLLGPWSTGVSDEAPGIKPRVFPPKFTAQGCEIVLKTEKAEYKAGEKPVVEIEANNPTDKAVETTVWINVSAADVPSPMSRRMAMPRPLWSQPWIVSLQPGEKKTAKIATAAKLQDGQNVSITMSNREQAVMAEEFPVRRGVAPTQAGQKPTIAVTATMAKK